MNTTTTTAPAAPTAAELAALLTDYNEWADRRQALSDAEEASKYPDPDDYLISGDDAADLAARMASALEAITAPAAEPTAEHDGVTVTLTTSERDGAVLVIVDTDGLDRTTGLRIDVNDGTVWDGNPESHTSGPPAPATPVPDDVLTVTYPSGRTLNVEREHLAWALYLRDAEPPSAWTDAVSRATTLADLNAEFDGINAKITRTPNPLAGFAIRAEELSDPSVVCTTCEEVVCTAEDSDSLEVLAGAALDHQHQG